MEYYRATAVIAGLLFITATVTAILSLAFLGSTLDAPGYLTSLSDSETQVLVSAILELVLAVSVAAIGFMLFPVLRKRMESLALGYAVIRLTEAILIIASTISLLSLLTLSRDYVAAATDASLYLPAGTALLAIRDWSVVLGTLIFLGLGGLQLYYLMYLTRLVPRWLAGWGLIGAALIFFTGILGLFGLEPESNTTTILAAPIAVQEMVFAVWLIARGFDRDAMADLDSP